MQLPIDINEYLRAWAHELSDRILQTYPPLHGFDDVASPLAGQLLRKPFPAQTLAMMGVVKRWKEARGAAVIAECGTGKTLISLGAVHVHSDRKPFTALAMVPPQIVEKWAREAFLTLPRVRVFFIDGLRTPTTSMGHVGVNEVRLRHGRIAVTASDVESAATPPEQELKLTPETTMMPTAQLTPVTAPFEATRHENPRRERALASQLRLF
jgi:superfamily II DNA or RNA helicase